MHDARKLIKALAIILIVNRDDEVPADDKYLPLATNLMDAEKAINELTDLNSSFDLSQAAKKGKA